MKRIIRVLIAGVFLSSCGSGRGDFDKSKAKLIKLSVDEIDFYQEQFGRNMKKSSLQMNFEEAKKICNMTPGNQDFLKILVNVFKENGSSLCMELYENQNCIDVYKESFRNQINLTKKILEKRLLNLNIPSELYWNDNERIYEVYYNGDIEVTEMASILMNHNVKFEFWETYKNTQIGNQIFEDVNLVLSKRMFPGYRDSVEKQKNEIDPIEKPKEDTVFEDISEEDWEKIIKEETRPTLSDEEQEFRKMYPLSAYLMLNVDAENMWVEGPVLGYAKITDTGIINEYLSKSYVKSILNRDLAFMWEANSVVSTHDNIPLLSLYLVKKTRSGVPELDGSNVVSASQDFEPGTNNGMVNLHFDKLGSIIWGDMTEKSAKENTGIAMVLDGRVMSAPVASGRIEGGMTQITGGSFIGPLGIFEAKNLADMLNAGTGKTLKLDIYSMSNGN